MNQLYIQTKTNLILLGETSLDQESIQNKINKINLKELSQDLLQLRVQWLKVNCNEDNAIECYNKLSKEVVRKHNLFSTVSALEKLKVQVLGNEDKRVIYHNDTELEQWLPNYSYSNEVQQYDSISFYIPEPNIIIKEKTTKDLMLF